MILSKSVKPISYVKSHASEVVRQINRDGKPLFVTLNGEAKVVIEDIREFEKRQESMALLKVLALGRKEVENGEVQSSEKAFRDIDARIRKCREER